MRKKALTDLLFWSLASASGAMLAGLVLLLAGVVELEPTPQSTAPAANASEPEPEQPAATTTEASAGPPLATAQETKPEPSPPAMTVVVMSAVRGDSWFSARAGSETGRVLDERVLSQGDSVKLEAERIWLTVGAAGHVDLTVNGKPRELAPGTVSLVLTRPRTAESS